MLPEGEDVILETPKTIHLHTLLIPDFISPLTIIKGHARLISRRATGETTYDTIRLEHSVAAIEAAVQRIVAALEQFSSLVAKEGKREPTIHCQHPRPPRPGWCGHRFFRKASAGSGLLSPPTTTRKAPAHAIQPTSEAHSRDQSISGCPRSLQDASRRR